MSASNAAQSFAWPEEGSPEIQARDEFLKYCQETLKLQPDMSIEDPWERAVAFYRDHLAEDEANREVACFYNPKTHGESIPPERKLLVDMGVTFFGRCLKELHDKRNGWYQNSNCLLQELSIYCPNIEYLEKAAESLTGDQKEIVLQKWNIIFNDKNYGKDNKDEAIDRFVCAIRKFKATSIDRIHFDIQYHANLVRPHYTFDRIWTWHRPESKEYEDTLPESKVHPSIECEINGCIADTNDINSRLEAARYNRDIKPDLERYWEVEKDELAKRYGLERPREKLTDQKIRASKLAGEGAPINIQRSSQQKKQQQQQEQQQLQQQQQQQLQQQQQKYIVNPSNLLTKEQFVAQEETYKPKHDVKGQGFQSDKLWDAWFGVPLKDHIQFITPEAAHHLVEWRHLFADGIDVDHLPPGFVIETHPENGKKILLYRFQEKQENEKPSPLIISETKKRITHPKITQPEWRSSEIDELLARLGISEKNSLLRTIKYRGIVYDRQGSYIDREIPLDKVMLKALATDAQLRERIIQDIVMRYTAPQSFLFLRQCDRLKSTLNVNDDILKKLLYKTHDLSEWMESDFEKAIKEISILSSDQKSFFTKLLDSHLNHSDKVDLLDLVQGFKHFCAQYKSMTGSDVENQFKDFSYSTKNLKSTLSRVLDVLEVAKEHGNLAFQLKHINHLNYGVNGAQYAMKHDGYRFVTPEMRIGDISGDTELKLGKDSSPGAGDCELAKASYRVDSYILEEALLKRVNHEHFSAICFQYLGQTIDPNDYEDYRLGIQEMLTSSKRSDADTGSGVKENMGNRGLVRRILCAEKDGTSFSATMELVKKHFGYYRVAGSDNDRFWTNVWDITHAWDRSIPELSFQDWVVISDINSHNYNHECLLLTIYYRKSFLQALRNFYDRSISDSSKHFKIFMNCLNKVSKDASMPGAKIAQVLSIMNLKETRQESRTGLCENNSQNELEIDQLVQVIQKQLKDERNRERCQNLLGLLSTIDPKASTQLPTPSELRELFESGPSIEEICKSHRGLWTFRLSQIMESSGRLNHALKNLQKKWPHEKLLQNNEKEFRKKLAPNVTAELLATNFLPTFFDKVNECFSNEIPFPIDLVLEAIQQVDISQITPIFWETLDTVFRAACSLENKKILIRYAVKGQTELVRFLIDKNYSSARLKNIAFFADSLLSISPMPLKLKDALETIQSIAQSPAEFDALTGLLGHNGRQAEKVLDVLKAKPEMLSILLTGYHQESEKTIDLAVVDLLKNLEKKDFQTIKALYSKRPAPSGSTLKKWLEAPSPDRTTYLKDKIQHYQKNPYGTRDLLTQFDDTKVLSTIDMMRQVTRGDHALLHFQRHQLAKWFSVVNTQGYLYPILVDGHGPQRYLSAKDLNETQLQELAHKYRAIVSDPDQPIEMKLKARLSFLSIAQEAMYRATGQFPHSTQMLSVLSAMQQGNYALLQIATGEGKGLTTALLASLLWLDGKAVDVCTSSAELAKRDLEERAPFFEYLGIPHGSSNITADSNHADRVKDGINYSDVSQLAIFRARTRIEKTYDDAPASLLLDEVDSVLLDKSENFLYAHPLGGEGYEWVYAALNEFIETEVFKDTKISAQEDIANAKKFLKSFAERHGVVGRRDFLDNDSQIDTWIDSAVAASRLILDKNYVIQADINAYQKPISVARLLLSEGGVDPEAEYSNGVQQFLHARLEKQRKEDRHSPLLPFEIKPETTILTVDSTKSFIDSYRAQGGKIMGMTGTLGSLEERQEQADKYGLTMRTIPTHHVQQRVDHAAKLLKDDKAVQKSTIDYIIAGLKENPPRPVLVICKDIEASEKMEKAVRVALAGAKLNPQLQLYNGKDQTQDPATISHQAGVAGCITITTSISARGIDYKPRRDKGASQQDHPKGLSVLVTCLLGDRAQGQSVGRSGRQGWMGETKTFISREELQNKKSPEETKSMRSARLKEQRLLRETYSDVMSVFFNDFYKKYQRKVDDHVESKEANASISDQALLMQWKDFMVAMDIAWKKILEGDPTGNIEDKKNKLIEIARGKWGAANIDLTQLQKKEPILPSSLTLEKAAYRPLQAGDINRGRVYCDLSLLEKSDPKWIEIDRQASLQALKKLGLKYHCPCQSLNDIAVVAKAIEKHKEKVFHDSLLYPQLLTDLDILSTITRSYPKQVSTAQLSVEQKGFTPSNRGLFSSEASKKALSRSLAAKSNGLASDIDPDIQFREAIRGLSFSIEGNAIIIDSNPTTSPPPFETIQALAAFIEDNALNTDAKLAKNPKNMRKLAYHLAQNIARYARATGDQLIKAIPEKVDAKKRSSCMRLAAYKGEAVFSDSTEVALTAISKNQPRSPLPRRVLNPIINMHSQFSVNPDGKCCVHSVKIKALESIKRLFNWTTFLEKLRASLSKQLKHVAQSLGIKKSRQYPKYLLQSPSPKRSGPS